MARDAVCLLTMIFPQRIQLAGRPRDRRYLEGRQERDETITATDQPLRVCFLFCPLPYFVRGKDIGAGADLVDHSGVI